VTSSRRVVFLGAGHAHLYGLKRAAAFARRGHQAVVVAPEAFWYSGLATGVLGGLYPPALDRVDVQALVENRGGRFIADRAVAIDAAARTVHLERSPPLAYDVLSVTLGSRPPPIPADPGAPPCYAVKPVRRLAELRADLEARFARAPDRPVRVAVAGGGATACEVAANVAALAAARGGRAEVTVLAAGPVLRQLPDRAARRVVRALEARGVAVRTPARVARLAAAAAVLDDGAAVACDLAVNATGLVPHPLLRTAGLPMTAEGALTVDRHLRSVGDPAVHGAGDCIALAGRPLPRVGVYAIRQAPVLYRNLLAALDGTAPARFTPQARYLWILNLGDGTGLAARGRLWWHGRVAFRLKDRIDRRFLREYRRAAESHRSTAAGHRALLRPEPATRDGHAMTEDEKKEIRDEFRRSVNMSPKELEDWLATEESRSVGWTREGEEEAVGHQSGRRIVTIKRTRQDDLADEDYAHMRKVIGYVHRHAAQRPEGEVTDTRWRYSLMNWGHDPLKEG